MLICPKNRNNRGFSRSPILTIIGIFAMGWFTYVGRIINIVTFLAPNLISAPFSSKMAAVNHRLLLQGKFILLLGIIRAWRLNRQRKQKRLSKKRRFWTRSYLQKREELGQYHTLVQELRIHDREHFFR